MLHLDIFILTFTNEHSEDGALNNISVRPDNTLKNKLRHLGGGLVPVSKTEETSYTP